MHVITWTGAKGQEIKRSFATLDEAFEMTSWLRSERIEFIHTFWE